MSLETQHFINGEEIRPKNADDIGVKLDWTGDIKEAELTVDSIVLENNAKRIVLNHIEQLGVFEGVPYTAKIGGLILEYYIDLTVNPLISGNGDSSIEVTIKRRKQIDYLREQFNGLSFEALNKTNPITSFDVPYLIVRDNQAEMLIMLLISAFTLTKELIQGIKELITIITAGTVQASTPNTGVPPSVDTGDIIAQVLRIGAQIVYLAGILIALIDLTKKIIELIFPPIRNLKGVKVKELCEKACAKFGFTFSSSIINENAQLTILPVPFQPKNKSIFTNLFTLDNGVYNKGYPTAQDSISTAGLMFDWLEEYFNAKLRIVGTQVQFEIRDFYVLNSGVSIKNTLNLQDVRENQWNYNLGEAWKRYFIHYRTDPSDTHTYDNVTQLDCEYSTEPVSIVNADLVSIKGLVDIAPPFAFGARKSKLTTVEEFVLPFAKLADEVVQFFGGSSDLVAKVVGRVGVLQISQQYFSVTKLMVTTNGKQPVNFLDQIGANSIYQKYHVINQVKENFKRIYSATIPFSTKNFEDLLENNYVTDELGNSLEILTFEYINESKTAEIEYSILSDEAFNTKTILING